MHKRPKQFQDYTYGCMCVCVYVYGMLEYTVFASHPYKFINNNNNNNNMSYLSEYTLAGLKFYTMCVGSVWHMYKCPYKFVKCINNIKIKWRKKKREYIFRHWHTAQP